MQNTSNTVYHICKGKNYLPPKICLRIQCHLKNMVMLNSLNMHAMTHHSPQKLTLPIACIAGISSFDYTTVQLATITDSLLIKNKPLLCMIYVC